MGSLSGSLVGIIIVDLNSFQGYTVLEVPYFICLAFYVLFIGSYVSFTAFNVSSITLKAITLFIGNSALFKPK